MLIDWTTIRVLAVSILSMVAYFLLAIGQVDRVRNNPDTSFNVNLSAGVFATVAGIISMFHILYHYDPALIAQNKYLSNI